MAHKVMIFSSVHQYDDSRVFHKEAKSLAEAGYVVELHALADFTRKEEAGVRIVGVKRQNKRWKRLLLGWQLYKRALKSGADIYHFHDPELLPWGYLIKLRTGSPVIYDSHEDLPKQIYTKQWIPAPLRKPISKMVERIEKGLAKRLTAVITATESIQQQFKQVSRVEVIKNYPLKMNHIQVDSSEKNIILYVGGISYLRGFREMVQMMDYIPPHLKAELHLIGPVQHIDEQELDRDQLAKKNITWHGRVPFDEVKKWLSKGKVGLVCLHPIENYRESLPIKMFEYMAAGLPLVATDFPLWKEIIHTSKCGETCDAYDPQDIAKKVTGILEDHEKQMAMGESGRKAFEELYNWKTQEQKLIHLYRDLLPKD
ncbi:glycosyltransferase family 4 protein [Hazenella sp. IB182357]|uniref:Glycosyltransferase family 4 protein n=1 Tax=Polycladospora coralii TaxID=2771432 RepID=A0A926RU63_9BACL|nr:glycosyltransferase family 4 protein [Polycladospora coralii]MBD1372182.1 glycosyltransferase family 4 protein [Polycladospora coralii]